MPVLHIEHGITDFTTWKSAFDRFAEKRKEGGVTAYRIYQPHDNAAYIVLQLDFNTVERARAFQQFLESRVWTTPANSPGLAGDPRSRVLVEAPAQ